MLLRVSPIPWRLGILIPAALASLALLDLVPRFLPVGRLHLYPYQVATRFPGRYAPFTPNLVLRTERSVGELALLANLPPTEVRRDLVFSTDQLGFRLTSGSQQYGPPRVLVMEGDSYTFGAGLSDHETFPALLQSELKTAVYNGGRFYTDPERLQELDWLLARLGGTVSTILYVLLEPVDLDLAKDHDQGAIDRLGSRLFGPGTYLPIKDELRFLHRWFYLWSAVAPLEITASRAYKRIANDAILPNEYKGNVRETRLPDGRRFLLEHKAVARYLHPPDPATVRKTAAYMAWLRDRLKERRLDLTIVLVPEAVSVYGSSLLAKPAPAVAEGLPYFDYLARELSRQEIRTVNGLDVLRASAPQDLRSGQLAYYREDHHWNPRGVRLMATAVAGAIDPARHERAGLH